MQASFSARVLTHLHIIDNGNTQPTRGDFSKKIAIQNRVIPIKGLVDSHFPTSFNTKNTTSS
jgi:hypothetical protein